MTNEALVDEIILKTNCYLLENVQTIH